jgi:hypothetical protein
MVIEREGRVLHEAEAAVVALEGWASAPIK